MIVIIKGVDTVSLTTRLILFIVGLVIMSVGVVLVIQAGLGSSPISSIPYVISLLFPYTLGEMTFAINAFFVLCQWAILRRMSMALLLQLPTVFLFSIIIDMSMVLLAPLAPTSYIGSLFFLLAASLTTALGITLIIIANLVILPGDGIVQVTAAHFGFDFGYLKVAFDTSCVIISAAIAFYVGGELCGLREGTLISALITGHFVRGWMRILTVKDRYGRMIFCRPFTKKPPSSIMKEQEN